MPIGAAIGGAVLTAGGTIAAGAMGADAQKDAAKSAADQSLAVAQLNAQLFEKTRDQNIALGAPFYNNGLLAGNALTDLLLGTHLYNQNTVANPSIPGGGTLPPFPAPGAGSGSGSSPDALDQWALGAISAMAPKITRSSTWQHAASISDPYDKLQYLLSQSPSDSDQYPLYQSYVSAHPKPGTGTPTTASAAGALGGTRAATGGALAAYSPMAATTAAPAATTAAPAVQGARGAFLPYAERGARPDTSGMSVREGIQATRDWRTGGVARPTHTPGTGTPTPAAGGAGAGGQPATAQSAWDAFRNSTNYQFRLNEGLGALESFQAARGSLDSGAATKSAIKFNQNFAANELSNYMNLLAGQQAVGAGTASSLMGVGNNFAGNVAAQNTAAANAAANAALVNGQAGAGMWGSIGQGVGQLGGALYQYGMGQQSPQASVGRAGGGYQVTQNPNYWAQNPWTGF